MPKRKRFRVFVLVAVLLPPLVAGAQQKAAPSQTSPAKGQKQPAPKPAARQQAAPSPKAKASAPPRRPVRRRAAVPQQQLSPTQERYAEIQAALAKAGYFSGPTNGNWGESSVKALREFQSDHRLEPTGKIDALTLLRLDLGPKYDEPTETAATPTPPPG